MEQLEARQLLDGANTAPVLDAINNATFPANKTLILPLTASDAEHDALTYTFTSSNPKVKVQLHKGNPFLKLSVANFGDITIELFHDLTPKTVAQITGLVQAGFYNGLTFHRVIPGFMIQGGDPQGTGSGGLPYQYADEFNANAIFTGGGQLAMANSGDDTNGSQFFITDSSPRHLDFNHTIFGQVVRGMDVARNIALTPRDSNDKPTTPVVISSAQLVTDPQDAVITLSGTGTSTITVNVSDGHGGTASKTFTATASTTDIYNSAPVNEPPFLGPIADRVMPVNTAIKLHLPVTDIDGGTLKYGWQELGLAQGQNPHIQILVNGPDFTIAPVNGYKGPVPLIVGVTEDNGQTWDTQIFTIGVGDKALTGKAAAVKAVAGMPLSMTVATFKDADLKSTAKEFTAQVRWGDGSMSAGKVTRTAAGAYTVTAASPYANPGRYPLSVLIGSKGGASATISTTAVVTRAALVPSAAKASKTELVVNGTSGNDTISLVPAGTKVQVLLNSVNLGTFVPTAGIRIFGGAGNDTISVDPQIAQAAIVYGGDGADTLTGGTNSILVGGAGDDTLAATAGRNILIGDAGLDHLTGAGGDDMLVADSVSYETNAAALRSVLAEWTGKSDYALRVQHLQGAAGGLNGKFALKAATLASDTSADVLTGFGGSDLFALTSTGTGTLDSVTDQQTAETAIDVA